MAKSQICKRCGGNNFKKSAKTAGGKQRWTCKNCDFRTTAPLSKTEYKEYLKSNETPIENNLEKSNTYLVTALQNNTKANTNFWEVIKIWKEYHNGKIIVIPFRYKNPTAYNKDTKENLEEYWWDSKTEKYLINQRFDITNQLSIMADISIQPTAENPLSGMDTIAHGKSCVYAHTKRHLSVIPTTPNHLPTIMMTTSALSNANYSNTKAGKKGEHHHCLGGVIINVNKKTGVAHTRHVTANKDGSFYDLDRHYTKKGVTHGNPVKGVILGDLHSDELCQKNFKTLFDERNGLIPRLSPEAIVLHDVYNGTATNPHEEKNILAQHKKYHSGQSNILQELEETCEILNIISKFAKNIYAVFSNHDTMLSRHVLNAKKDWRADPENAEILLELATHLVKVAKGEASGDAFQYFARSRCPDVKFLDSESTTFIGNYLINLHGNKGANGARGNINTFAKVGYKTITGHTHTPGRKNGAIVVGTSSILNPDYIVGGLSSWINSHALVYADNHASQIHIINGDYE